MNLPSCRTLRAVFTFALGALSSQAADIDGMLSQCRVRAGGSLRVAADEVTVKCEGQGTDKTHTVNGSAVVRGQNRTFQCSFAPSGARISR